MKNIEYIVVLIMLVLFPLGGYLLARTVISIQEETNCEKDRHFHEWEEPCWDFPRDLFRNSIFDKTTHQEGSDGD